MKRKKVSWEGKKRGPYKKTTKPMKVVWFREDEEQTNEFNKIIEKLGLNSSDVCRELRAGFIKRNKRK